MRSSSVLVVGESPSLGRSIADLLESEGIPSRCVPDLEGGELVGAVSQRYPVVVAASSGYFCDTGRRWLRGELPGVSLVVVGSRDPLLDDASGLYRVLLPLQPGALVRTVRALFNHSRSSVHSADPKRVPARASPTTTGLGLRSD